MTTQFQLRRGTTAEHATFTGAVGEITYDTELKTARVHDGSTSSGFQISRADVDNVSNPQFSGTSSLKLPNGTTAQRPTATNGRFRYNSTTGVVESVVNSSYQNMGVINQIQHVVTDTVASYTAGGNDAIVFITPLEVTITPSSTNSRILIFARLEGEASAVGYDSLWTITRGTTSINLAPSAGSRIRGTGVMFDTYGSGGDNGSTPEGIELGMVMDSPSTTSATTYKLGVRQSTGTITWYLNRTVADINSIDSYERFTSEMVAMEVVV